MGDSPRWCETCKAHGDHHTDRHPMMMALTDQEKAYFNTIRDKAAVRGGLHLTRMLLDGKPVGVILTPVYNRFTNQPEGMMPLSLVLDEETISRLTQLDGEKGKPASPFDLDPDR